MKRKPNDLVPSEIAVLEVAQELYRLGTKRFHGYQIAKAIDKCGDKSYANGYGTLYRALERLEKLGFLTSYWEEVDASDRQKPPRRRFYQLTGKPAPARLKATVPSCVLTNYILGRATP
jgi:PadR family transcriptional regulator, regulatory protein PadR